MEPESTPLPTLPLEGGGGVRTRSRESRGGAAPATGITSLSAATLVTPATVVVVILLVAPLLILFRYSLNRFVPGQFMVEALTVENYAKVFVDPYYRTVLLRTA